MRKPASPLWGPLGAMHHWGESQFGYYLAADAYVLRRHAQLLADAGVVALASLVSPLKSDRETARALNDAAKLPFIEVHIATSLAECEKRDPKGLYARARSGELKGLTGIDAPYAPPETADLVLDTTGANIDDLVAQVIDLLDKRSPRGRQP